MLVGTRVFILCSRDANGATTGFLHPIIHLGFGVEFKQPAVIAEALAQTALHDEWIGKLLLVAEKAAAERTGEGSKSLVQLLDEMQQDQKLVASPNWKDGNKIRDGVLARAPDEMIKYASQYTVRPEDLEEKTAEMINASSEPWTFYLRCIVC